MHPELQGLVLPGLLVVALQTGAAVFAFQRSQETGFPLCDPRRALVMRPEAITDIVNDGLAAEVVESFALFVGLPGQAIAVILIWMVGPLQRLPFVFNPRFVLGSGIHGGLS